MMLFIRDDDGNYSEHITIQTPSINETKQNMTITSPGLQTDKDYSGLYYKIYSYFVESDAYTFEYNESPTVDFMPSVNEKEIIEGTSYLSCAVIISLKLIAIWF